MVDTQTVTTTYATHGGPGAASDPTAVMGRRILAWILDGIVYLALMFGVLALVGEYQDVDAGYDDNVEFCQDLLDDNPGFDGNCIGPPFGDRVYLIEYSDSMIQSGVAFAWFVLNFVLLQGLVGATVGKLLTGLRVVNVQGARAGIGRCFVRSVAWIVDGITCGVPIVGGVAAVTSNGHRRVGDMIAGTRVVGTKSVGTPVDTAPVAAPAGSQPWGAAPPTVPQPSVPPAWDQPSPPPPSEQPRYGEPPAAPPPGFGAPAAAPPAWPPPGESEPTPDPTTVSPAFDPTLADTPVARPVEDEPTMVEPAVLEPDDAERVEAEPPIGAEPTTADSGVGAPERIEAPPSGARVDLPPPAGPLPDSESPETDTDDGWIGGSTDEPDVDRPSQESDPWMVGAEQAEEATMPPSGETEDAEPTWTDLDVDPVEGAGADESIPPDDVHTTAQATEGAGSLPLPDPQWDEARNTYLQWDPNKNAWLQWDDGRHDWKPIDT